MIVDHFPVSLFYLVGHFDGIDPETPEFTYVHYIDVHGPWEGAPFEDSYEAAIRNAVAIRNVAIPSPVHDAGIKPGDRILQANGKPLRH